MGQIIQMVLKRKQRLLVRLAQAYAKKMLIDEINIKL